MDLPSLHRDIVEHSRDALWVTDLYGNTLYANAAFARLYGVALDEVSSVTVLDTLDDFGKGQYAEHMRLFRAGTFVEDDVEVLFHDVHGTTTWISLGESPLYEDGVLVAVVNRFYPYDTRRNVLDDLRASREALNEAQELARLGSWVFDIAKGTIERLGGVRLLGPAQEVSGLADFMALVHPEERSSLGEFAAHTLARPGEFEVDMRLAAKGEWLYLRVRGVVHAGADGTPERVTGTHQDVTAMRLAEIALRDEVIQSALLRQVAAAANAAHTLSEVLDIVRPLLWSHDDWIRSAAFRVDESGAMDPLDEDVLPEEEALCRAALASQAAVWSDDQRTIAFRVAQAERVYAVGTISASTPITRRDLVEMMADAVSVQLARVAEREEGARTLAKARDQAMAASRQKSEFLATMSHEIRTPLNGIIGLTDLLRRTSLDADQQRLLSGMQSAGHTLLDVLNDVLDFSKLDGRPIELETVDVDLRSLVDQVTRVVSGAARANSVELVVWCDDTVPALVLADPTRLSQVLMNLVSNAVKFSPQGEVLIKVRAAQSDEQVSLCFEVVDNGIGVETEQIDRLFEPFTQADTSTTRRFGGTGLGLSIAREITAAMGGEISYAPNPTGGSIFSFSVGCRRHPGTATDLDDYARTWLAGRRVLVADSSALRAPALREQLHWWQISADVAADVPQATELLARSLEDAAPYTAVLIDARLAGGGGMRLVSDIATESAYDEVAMIVIGSDLEVDLNRLRESGVSVFLERPVSAETLRGTLLEQLVGVPSQPMGRMETPDPDSSRPRILIVEDNVVNQIVASGLLASLGYRWEIAHNGADALEILALEGFDAVLMDVQMPVLDGYSATRTLREREARGTHIPVIAMTAAAIAGERERCLAAGMDEFLTKPVDRTALANALERWIVVREETMTDEPPSDGSALPPTAPIEGLDTVRLDMLRDLDPGETSYIDRAIGNFTTNSVTAESSIADLVTRGDATGLQSVAHKIAGSALNLGVPRAGEAARALELLATTGTTEGAAELLAELHAAMAEGRTLLAAYQATYSSPR